ncbi:hypothetical protein ES288_A13G141700v1 [Gossypium darwinii]|uniref:Uncharacterized protein n=1 Tax=Gossypium darwinii TaxID=34276 RepID=A0A5D2DZF8_GOSDA|nr:hypothetical protein ES288_A13G141700v1 [Gossypium darwinii]
MVGGTKSLKMLLCCFVSTDSKISIASIVVWLQIQVWCRWWLISVCLRWLYTFVLPVSLGFSIVDVWLYLVLYYFSPSLVSKVFNGKGGSSIIRIIRTNFLHWLTPN